MDTVCEALDRFFQSASVPVLFAGAGVSARAGLPTWDKYLAQLAAAINQYDQYTKFQMDKSVAEGRLDVAASYYYLCQDIPQATRLKELAIPLEKYNSSSLKDLAALPFNCFVTTNFDEALINAYSEAHGKAARLMDIDDSAMAGASFEKKFYIARIHGRVEFPPSMRLAREHFEALQKNRTYNQFLTHILTHCNVLFVGFSFLDPAITAVLRSVKSTFNNLHGREHFALIPDSSSAEFEKELESHDIRKMRYSANSQHYELWNGISAYREIIKASNIEPKDETTVRPFAVAQKYLATAYARMKIGGAKKSGTLSLAMTEGIVSGMITRSYSAGITEEKLVEQLRLELSLDMDLARMLISQSVTSLVADGICVAKNVGNPTRFVATGQGDDSYEKAITRLADGALKRFLVREKGQDSAEIRAFLNAFFVELVLNRGWDLGAAFAAKRMPEDVDVYAAMIKQKYVGRRFKESLIFKLASSVEDLLARPDDAEATLLAELGRLGFGLELLIQTPKDALFYERALPERLYLDANVLMPAITPGHPHKAALESTIKLLQRNATRSAVSISVCVYYGFLNEIVSHRQLAIHYMRENGGEGAMWAEREVSLLGPSNVNVYVGAYFNMRVASPALTFDAFLKRYAPYTTEGELKTFLEKAGYDVISTNQVQTKNFREIIHCLELFYATALENQRKSPTVILHDATQLALISYDMQTERRSIFVSADRKLRIALDQGGFAWLGNGMITHLGLTQLVDLLFGGEEHSRGVASLLWMSTVSSGSERIRNHLINLALSHHNAALAMSMTDVVDAIAVDASRELEADDLDIDDSSRSYGASREKVNNVLGRYETEFFDKMSREIKRIENRS